MSSSLRILRSLLCAGAVALALLAPAHAEEAPTIAKFSDLSKPGTLKVVVGRGSLTIKGGDAAEVAIKSEAKPTNAKPRKDGLRA